MATSFDDVRHRMVRVTCRLAVLPQQIPSEVTGMTWGFNGADFDANDTLPCDAIGQCANWHRDGVVVVWFPRYGKPDAFQPIFARLQDIRLADFNAESVWNEGES